MLKIIKQRYIKSNGVFCPVCKSKDLITGELEVIDTGINQDVCCANCHSEWIDSYKLSHFTMIKEEKIKVKKEENNPNE